MKKFIVLLLSLVLCLSVLSGCGGQGEKGDKGDTGAQGPQGVQGPQGPQGPQGDGVGEPVQYYELGDTVTVVVNGLKLFELTCSLHKNGTSIVIKATNVSVVKLKLEQYIYHSQFRIDDNLLLTPIYTFNIGTILNPMESAESTTPTEGFDYTIFGFPTGMTDLIIPYAIFKS